MFLFAHGPWSALMCLTIFQTLMSVAVISTMAWLPAVFPRERYGQFCSAAGLVISGGIIFLSPLCGWVIDQVGSYRILFLWYAAFGALCPLGSWVVYRRWKALGGGTDQFSPP